MSSMHARSDSIATLIVPPSSVLKTFEMGWVAISKPASYQLPAKELPPCPIRTRPSMSY